MNNFIEFFIILTLCALVWNVISYIDVSVCRKRQILSPYLKQSAGNLYIKSALCLIILLIIDLFLIIDFLK